MRLFTKNTIETEIIAQKIVKRKSRTPQASIAINIDYISKQWKCCKKF